MRELLGQVHALLTSHERRRALGLFVLMTAMALIEMLSIVSILPFITVAANPEALTEEGLLARAYEASGAPGERIFLMWLGLVVLAVLIFGNAFKAYTTWKINHFVNMVGHEIAVRLVRGYLQQPYAWFLTRHSADLAKNVLAEVVQVVNGVIQPGMLALSRAVIALGIGALLFAADPVVALLVVAVLGGAYAALYTSLRAFVSRSGKARFEANRARYHVVSESFAGVKEVKLRGLEQIAIDHFSAASERFAHHQAVNATLAAAPRYGLEIIAFGGVLALVLYLLAARGGIEAALPLIALYAFAGYRMLPTVQEVYAGATKMRFAAPALALLHRDLAEKGAARLAYETASAPLPFRRELHLERVSFSYAGADGPALRDVDLVIPRGARVGISGPTGSGKSTLVDLILGLLAPTSGRILVDGTSLDTPERVRAWQANIGYVPQSIFIADDTIAANIAFGRPPEEVDRAAVERAARAAQLHDFIVSELPGGYDATVGERGVRLSGGQRQRLGLARALYDEPAVIVLDEATSALDEATEDAVMAAINALGEEITVIMIAHRLRTLEGCGIVVEVAAGKSRCVATPSSQVE